MAANIRNNLTRLANTLLDEGQKEKAVDILNKLMVELPPELVPNNHFSIFLAEAYYKAGEFDKGDEIIRDIAKEFMQDITFYSSLSSKKKQSIMRDLERVMAIYERLLLPTVQMYDRKDLLKELEMQYSNSVQKLKFMKG
jgi:predicted Zn-dependent protease